jgi:hypothetical protein
VFREEAVKKSKSRFDACCERDVASALAVSVCGECVSITSSTVNHITNHTPPKPLLNHLHLQAEELLT